MIEGIDSLLIDSQQPGLAELRATLHELLGGRAARGRLIDQRALKPKVYRLHFTIGSCDRSVVVKRLDPGIARRNQLVAQRWLPAASLGHAGPPLLGIAAERSGQSVWHIYDDLGDWSLEAREPDSERIAAVTQLVAQLHMRFAEHPLLPECRLYGDDLGIHFFASNVRDAIRALEALRPPSVALTADQLALRDRLLERMYRLRDQQPGRARALAEIGGPETLLHGDLWTANMFVFPTAHGLQARLIDWDHSAVGPISYDLSTLLLRFPADERMSILGLYQDAVAHLGWRLPCIGDLNLLFDTAECARFANRILWPAIALWEEQAAWGFEALAEVEQWFEAHAPVLPSDRESI